MYIIHLLLQFGANIPMLIIYNIHIVIGAREVNIHYRMLGITIISYFVWRKDNLFRFVLLDHKARGP